MEKESSSDTKSENEFQEAPTVKKSENMFKKVFNNITIEPALFLTSFAGQLGDATFGQMVIYKSCKSDFGYNSTVCNNLIDDFPDQNTEIQNEVAQFNTYQIYVTTLLPAFLAFYLGAWADLFGRKVVLYMTLTTWFLKHAIFIVLAYFLDSPKEYVLLADIPTNLSGGIYGFHLAINTFLSDITAPENRAFRYGKKFIIPS